VISGTPAGNKKILLGIMSFYQKTLVSILIHFLKKDGGKIFIGCHDIGNNTKFLKDVFKDQCITVLKREHKFYNYSPDIRFPFFTRKGVSANVTKMLVAPFIFLYCMAKCRAFIYFWSESLLLDRSFEFKVLKKHRKVILTRHLGCDIRHWEPALDDLRKKSLFHVCGLCKYAFSEVCNRKEKQRIAQESDKYADIIYSSTGMPSFLTRKYKTTRIPLNLEDYEYSFSRSDIPKIVHAPSDPVLKGTSIIRLALTRLRSENYCFDYIEITGQNNDRVIEALMKSQIVIDQLGGCGIGLFALEAMACGNVLLSGADAKANQEIPEDCPVITVNPLTIYEKLKWVLDHREEWEAFAMKGRKYVEKYHDKEKVSLLWKQDIAEIIL
jgi:glycosyltransferase involved in cell wall biosynthesis